MQADEGQDVEELAFQLLSQSIQQVEELKRYHALRASLHLLYLQVRGSLQNVSIHCCLAYMNFFQLQWYIC